MNPRIWLIASIISGFLSVFFFLTSIIEKRRANPFGPLAAETQTYDPGSYSPNAPTAADSEPNLQNTNTEENVDPNIGNTLPEVEVSPADEGFPSNLPSYDSAPPDLWVRISRDENTCWLVVPANKPNGVRAIAPDGRKFEIRVGERITLTVEGSASYEVNGRFFHEGGESQHTRYGGLTYTIDQRDWFYTIDGKYWPARYNGVPRFRVVDLNKGAYADNLGYYTVIIQKG